MAGEKEQVSWLHHPSEPHEEARVEEQGGGHVARNLFNWFIRVQHRCTHQGPVGGRTPEVNGLWTHWRVHEGAEFIHFQVLIA